MTGAPQTREIHIGLLFHSFESGNLGVGAFTVCNAHIIGQTVERYGGTPVFHVIGARGNIDYREDCPWPNDFTNVGTRSLVMPGSDLHKVFNKCDVFFDIGAGDGFSDLYRTSRLFRSVACKILAARTGKTLVLSPQTIGPFVTHFGKHLARVGLKAADRTFARDEMSLVELQKLGFADRSTLTTDLALALPYTPPASKRTGAALAGGSLNVGLNVSGFLFAHDGTDTGRVRLSLDYQGFTRRLIERLSADQRVASIHIVPHVHAPHMPGDHDGTASAQLAKEYPHLVIAPEFGSPSAAKSYIAGLDLFMGARMHSTIAAVSSNTVVLPLAYSRKFNGLYESLGYPWMVDMVNEGETAAMAEVDRILDNLPDASTSVMAANAKAQQMLRVYYDHVDRVISQLLPA